MEQILQTRKITDQESFLNPHFEKHTHAPEKLKDLPKAVERIQKAIRNGERILIVGDYDADGITASTILFKALQALSAKVSVRLPHRIKHGYGLNSEFINEAKELGVKLIITVDNGISAKKEVELANSLYIDVIITDHHLPPIKLPKAFAIVNPRQEDCIYQYKHLSGAGIAYKLAISLLANSELGTRNSELSDEILALAAIGTIADVCPLTGENRVLVAEGLKKIPELKNLGLLRILENAALNKIVTTEDIGFRIGPRLNAAGRLADPLLAFQALSNGHGKKFADELELLNRERQVLTKKMCEEVEVQLGKIDDRKILIASNTNWHPGVIGLAAGKLAEQCYRPAIIMSAEGDKLTGSCRSPIAEFNITAALNEAADLLKKFGGHRAAAGFELPLKNLAQFEERLNTIAERELAGLDLNPTLALDLEISETDLNFELFENLKRLAPFGEGNPEPVLYWPNAEIREVNLVGNGEKHLRFRLGKNKITAIAFNFGTFGNTLRQRETTDLVFALSENIWNGNRELQLKVLDLK